ncbi:MAG: glutamine synthetase family protein [Pseudomonadota bacterium]
MKLADFVMICVNDYGGQMRGKGFPAWELGSRLHTGMGIAPTSMMITTFGDIIDTPWGPRGELLMMPDADTEVSITLDDRPPERFLIADLVHLDGTPWAGCPRSWARSGLEALEQEAGVVLKSAFEHEFHYSGAEQRLGDAYLLDGMRVCGDFPTAALRALAECGIEPESFMPEYGPQQFEVTCKPALGLASADRAVMLREIVRAIARHYGHKATFSPVMANGAVGNGTHIHFSLQDTHHNPISYDATRPDAIGEKAGQFLAGILRDMPAIVALTAPSVVSYERMKPNRWSPTYSNLGDKDREAGLRLCPISTFPGSDPEAQCNFEYRACDAAASPYLALGALVWAGLGGIRDKLPVPRATTDDPEKLSKGERAQRGIVRLPQSLPEALDNLSASERAKSWMGETLMEAYLVHKHSELKVLEGLSPDEQVERYTQAY